MPTNSITFVDVYHGASDALQFFANGVTFLLGAIALWGLIFHRQKIKNVIRIMLASFLNERVKRIRETLGKLESINYNDKEDRQEIVDLLGQVSGQIKPLATTANGLEAIHVEIGILLDKKTQITEATKRKILFELHGRLDDMVFDETKNILK